jgi:lipopolysaccharide export system protein LptC
MIGRRKLAVILVISAGVSYWILQALTEDEEISIRELAHYPDYYMHDFTTLTMDIEGKPKNRLTAEYMAHYPDDNTSELNQPRMEIFQESKPPIYVRSDKGWVTSDNEVILLSGNVYLY